MAATDSAISGPHLARLLGAWRSSHSAYSALAAAIRLLVLDGRLPLRTRLPGERELASALGVSRTTATAAYDALRAEGFLASRRGSGSWTSLPADRRAASTPAGAAPARRLRRSTSASPRRPRPTARCTVRSPRPPRSCPGTCPGPATTRSGCPCCAPRSPRTSTRRGAVDLARAGAGHRRGAARVDAPAAACSPDRATACSSSIRPTRTRWTRSAPSERGRAGRAGPGRLGSRDARGDAAPGGAAARLRDPGPPEPDRADAARCGARGDGRAGPRHAHAAARRRDDRRDPARRRRARAPRRWRRTTQAATP